MKQPPSIRTRRVCGANPLQRIVPTLALGLVLGLSCGPALGQGNGKAEGNAALLEEISATHGLSAEQSGALASIFAKSRYIGQGNPAVTRHPMSPEQCRAKLSQAQVDYANPEHAAVCGGPNMKPLYDPARETAKEAKACIDQFEFPNIACSYPVVWVRAREAAEICAAMGKRLCDAHEWEGACQGALQAPDYRFDLAKGLNASPAVGRMREAHNRAHGPSRRWAYGPQYRQGVCGAGSSKSAGCAGGEWNKCGSNTYPSGAFPECQSPLGVLDQHGNAAEHMNLPLEPAQMTSAGSTELGVTEMKGSWFIFDTYKAHEDWCRWRAPYWHGSRVMDASSHHNYHLGFRCCKSVGTP